MHLRKLTASLLSASLALGILATAVPAAQAQPWHGGPRGGHRGPPPPPPRGGYYGGHRGGGGGAGLAVGSGLAGLAVGAMLGSTLAERGAAAPPPAYYPTPAPAAPPPAYYPYGGGY
ncbi:hypothetical protein [Komagataeibacter diospyri]|uniref:Transmembrane protein n=1 Tax=Komagataeibacter diospyri TaxID=1932662 RepID=A0A4P5P775_9PROT|nr:hypothetical protein [Komagataeibacter diospyri]GCE84301.1 hypothetical protein MSKU9_2442 [Komagataeibacter diospyri]GCE91139.1 hypothetical protein MSKU15_2740 [Komagataeibacter diospyri]